MKSNPILAILEIYDKHLGYAKKVDKYIGKYMDTGTYTLDDIEGILETMTDESIQYLILLFPNRY